MVTNHLVLNQGNQGNMYGNQGGQYGNKLNQEREMADSGGSV